MPNCELNPLSEIVTVFGGYTVCIGVGENAKSAVDWRETMRAAVSA